jgi:hypothetical protein
MFVNLEFASVTLRCPSIPQIDAVVGIARKPLRVRLSAPTPTRQC